MSGGVLSAQIATICSITCPCVIANLVWSGSTLGQACSCIISAGCICCRAQSVPTERTQGTNQSTSQPTQQTKHDFEGACLRQHSCKCITACVTGLMSSCECMTPRMTCLHATLCGDMAPATPCRAREQSQRLVRRRRTPVRRRRTVGRQGRVQQGWGLGRTSPRPLELSGEPSRRLKGQPRRLECPRSAATLRLILIPASAPATVMQFLATVIL